jgi:hypothetical protein
LEVAVAMQHEMEEVAAPVRPVQLLSMALGYMDASKRYSADAGTWAQALMAMRGRFEERYPELYGQFGFRQAPHSKPYSRDVSEFLTHMQLALAVGVGNPEFKVLEIKAGAQRDLLEPYENDERYGRALAAARELAAALGESEIVQADPAAGPEPA